jgi:hypothetical protein
MDDHFILGVHITNRAEHAVQVQEHLTEYGCCIKTRLGLHEVSEDACSPNGLLLLECCGGEDRCEELRAKLNDIPGVECKALVFRHD